MFLNPNIPKRSLSDTYPASKRLRTDPEYGLNLLASAVVISTQSTQIIQDLSENTDIDDSDTELEIKPKRTVQLNPPIKEIDDLEKSLLSDYESCSITIYDMKTKPHILYHSETNSMHTYAKTLFEWLKCTKPTKYSRPTEFFDTLVSNVLMIGLYYRPTTSSKFIFMFIIKFMEMNKDDVHANLNIQTIWNYVVHAFTHLEHRTVNGVPIELFIRKINGDVIIDIPYQELLFTLLHYKFKTSRNFISFIGFDDNFVDLVHFPDSKNYYFDQITTKDIILEE